MGKGGKKMGTAMRRLTLNLLVLLAVFAFAKESQKLAMPPELQAEELPWFGPDAKDGKGTYNAVINNDKLKEIAKQRKKTRIVFSFFATWCAPCKVGLAKLSKNSEQLKKQGVLVVLVNVAEKDVDNYNYGKIESWAKEYYKEEWLLVFDRFGSTLEDFGLSKSRDNIPLPRTLVTDANLRPLMLLGYEGDDFPGILWSN
jgi:thiol-disulfide isomerase/thioredoxin